MDYRQDIATRHGYPTFADLLDWSYELPSDPFGPKSYMARDPRFGFWFVWEDRPRLRRGDADHTGSSWRATKHE